MFTTSLKFTPGSQGASQFSRLMFILVDAGNESRVVALSKAEVQAAAVDNLDGSYTVPVTFPVVSAGPYTITAQAQNTSTNMFGPIATGAGVVSLVDGVWFPSPVAFV